ncbi:MAG TPA: hypothetical protein VH743_11970 [Beijerinckiaceae bacterium]
MHELPVFNLASLLIAALLLCIMVLRWGMPRRHGLAVAMFLGAWACAYMTFRIVSMAGVVTWQ